MLSKTRFQTLLAFTRKKERASQGRFFVEGWRWLEEALALPTPPECVLVAEDAPRSASEETLLARARAVAREYHEATPKQLARLTESATPPGVAALVPWAPATQLPRRSLAPGPRLLVALDAVADPGNAGTIIRTADWFGASGVLMGDRCVEASNSKLIRSTMGSLFHLPIVRAGTLLSEFQGLRESGYTVVGASLTGEALPGFTWPQRTVLVIGNEANGIQPDVAAALDLGVRIPSHGRAESLNAGIAAAVLMADWRARGVPPGEMEMQPDLSER